MEHLRNDSDRENPNFFEKSLPGATLYTSCCAVKFCKHADNTADCLVNSLLDR
jgi:hypothetical protein